MVTASEEPPTADAVREKIVDMLAVRISRESAASWAEQWVMADDPVVEDRDVWRALKRLAGADSRVSPQDYLFSEPDFHQWLADLEADAESEN